MLTDIWTLHEYVQKVEPFVEKLAMGPDGLPPRMDINPDGIWTGQPIICSEYGGIKSVFSIKKEKEGWGYGDAPKSEDEFYRRLYELTKALVGMKYMCGYTYTQLTDVEQEQNGIYNYDRTKKFNMKKVKAVFEMEPEEYKKK
ncbi:MAG: hypothetical protein V1752_01150 [Candidatus Firestonebacteria bacterium]